VFVFIVDHGPLLEALGEPRLAFARRCMENGVPLSRAFVEGGEEDASCGCTGADLIEATSRGPSAPFGERFG
jgi:hypothetical protein